ncbi:MAG: hypothetical protein E6J17_08005 [Chloroflexi bacterium]|nr:MAG: hypothetical protein E6J17_08005 [Chloroflexota bacterium]
MASSSESRSARLGRIVKASGGRPAVATISAPPPWMPITIAAAPPVVVEAMSAKPDQIAATGSADRTISARAYSTVVLACQMRLIARGGTNATR